MPNGMVFKQEWENGQKLHEEELLQDPGNTFESHLIIVKPLKEQKD